MPPGGEYPLEMQSTELDQDRVKIFARELLKLYTGSVLTRLIALGHDLGLFNVLAQGAATSDELATRAHLQERYVREWLGAMATGGFVTYDVETKSYALPAEHALLLAGDTGRNMAPFAGLLEALGSHMAELEDCFRVGGGIPYSSFRPAFTQRIDDSWRRIYDDFLLSQFLPLDAELPARLKAGCSAVDIGCGSSHAVNVMAAAYPRSKFIGYDIGEDAIVTAKAEAARLGLSNAIFEVLDVTRLAAQPKQDVIFAFDAIHDQVDPQLVLRRVAGALKPDGIFYAVDFKFASDVAGNLANPFAPMYYGIGLIHRMTVSLAEGGAGLGTVWGVELATQMLRDAGFANIEVRDTPRPQNCTYICRF